MQTIGELMKGLWISKDQMKDFLSKEWVKEATAKTPLNEKQIQQLKKAYGATQKDDPKAFRAGEIGFSDDSFLAWMWFSFTDEKTKVHNIDITDDSTDDFVYRQEVQPEAQNRNFNSQPRQSSANTSSESTSSGLRLQKKPFGQISQQIQSREWQWASFRPQRTDNRQQSTGSRVQGTDSRSQSTGDRFQRTSTGYQGTANRTQSTGSRPHTAGNRPYSSTWTRPQWTGGSGNFNRTWSAGWTFVRKPENQSWKPFDPKKSYDNKRPGEKDNKKWFQNEKSFSKKDIMTAAYWEDEIEGQDEARTSKKTAPAFPKRPEAKTSQNLVKKTSVEMPATITVKEFSEKMWVPLPELLKKFILNKIIVNVNTSIDFETASLIWEEFGVKVQKEQSWLSIEDTLSWNLQAILASDKWASTLELRAPTVTIMGHVDHGKTKLLDYIRKTNIVAWEAGWITQSIWASQIIHNWKKINFIDTPWHELFTSLRSRWSKITDLVIIVVAADDWVKPQTVEAINHAKDAWVPIMVAINKIDKPNINIEMVKSQLSEHGLIVEEWWGDIVCIWVSAISGEWIDELLDMVLLQTEMMDLWFNPTRNAVWVVLEANKDAKQWVSTSILLMSWTLRVWDIFVIHDTFGKVKKIFNWKNEEVSSATGWDPIMILGLGDVPQPWRVMEVVDSEKLAHQKVAMILETEKQSIKQSSVESLLDKISKWEKVVMKVIFKADNFGSLEALKYAMEKLNLPENIEVKVIHSGIGAITEYDINFAHASQAIIIWFNLALQPVLKKKADQLLIDVKLYDIIYEVIDYLERLALWLVKVKEEEVYLWKLNLLGVFFRRWNEMIIGWKVIDWKIQNWAFFRAHRWTEIIASWKVTSLKKETENVDEIGTGYECWMKVKVDKKLQEEDQLEFYVIQ